MSILFPWDAVSAIGDWFGGIGAIWAVFYAARQVKVAIMQIEENRNLVLKQLEEQRKLAEQNLEEQRKLAEENRAPKISIHTALRERKENGRKYRYLMITATNTGTVPIFLTKFEVKDIGSPRYQIINNDFAIDFMTNDGIPIPKFSYFWTSAFRMPNDQFPKALNPGEFITCTIKLNDYEEYLIESLKANDETKEMDNSPSSSPEKLERIQAIKDYYYKLFETNQFKKDQEQDSWISCLAVIFKDSRGYPFEKIIGIQCTASETEYNFEYRTFYYESKDEVVSENYSIMNRKINFKYYPGINAVYCMKDKKTDEIFVDQMQVGGLIADTLDKAKAFIEEHFIIDPNRYELTKIDEIFSADSIDDLTLYEIRDSHRYFLIRLKRLHDAETVSSVIGFPKWILEKKKIKELIQIYRGYELIEIKEIAIEEIKEEIRIFHE